MILIYNTIGRENEVSAGGIMRKGEEENITSSMGRSSQQNSCVRL